MASINWKNNDNHYRVDIRKKTRVSRRGGGGGGIVRKEKERWKSGNVYSNEKILLSRRIGGERRI